VYSITIGDVLRFRASDEPLLLLGALKRKGWAPVSRRNARGGARKGKRSARG
jgi:hypothetical protein